MLLIIHNQRSRTSLEAVGFAREWRIVILTIYSHISHKMQPLHGSVFAAFKVANNNALNDWIISNISKSNTNYDVAECSANTMNKAI